MNAGLRTVRLWIIAAVVLALGTMGMVVAPMAHADTDPTGGLPATVSADPLPTWQVNGVVWSQVTVGNVVYATGSFTTARPPGVAVGGAGQISVGNLIAYDIRTGLRVASFNHTLNAQGVTITASPDGSRVYVGGDFTTVDGVARAHIAAFDTATGALDTSFHPTLSNQVHAIAATNTTVYAGGAFFNASGSARTRLAAFNAANGALLPWYPKADDNNVMAMVMAPDDSRVIVGGSFTTLNGVAANGMGALDATTGATLQWTANTIMKDGGTGSYIDTLRTDGTYIYGGGMAFQTGDFEGSFAADPDTGNVVWLNDCHGDTYDVFPLGQVLYTVSHAHNCTPIGAFPQSSPSWNVNMRHALAFTTYPTGTNSGPDDYGWNYSGQPDSTLLQWFPELALGSFTGQYQAAWSLTGNSQYVAAGGEFPSVNGMAQQGLVRFAVKSIAPNKVGPTRAPGAPTPTAKSISSGTARVSWQSAYDEDNENLTYSVYRSGTAAPVYTTTQPSNYWTYPGLGFIDKGLTPGATYSYSVRVSDPAGNTITLPRTNTVTISSNVVSQYVDDVTGDGATAFWRLGEPSGSAVYDWAGFNDATAQSGVSRGAAGPISGDSTTASTFDGSSSDGYVSSNSTMATTPSFSIEAWVKTTTRRGGKIVGYGSSATGNSSSYDRHIYMDNSGHFYFGVYPGSTQVISSPKTYNDGSWHYVVASLDPTSGMTLYVDGKKVSSNPGVTTAQDYTGFWRIGGDNLGSWPNAGRSDYFAGTIGDVAIYPQALTLAQVQTHYTDGGGALNIPPAPKDAYGKAVYNSSPDFFWRLDESDGPTAADASRNEEPGVYTSSGVTYGQPGALNGQGTAVTFDGSSGNVASVDEFNNPTTYSEELWFNTTTTSGGKLIGFGNAQTGLSSNYDRHVYMTPDGKLNFGVYTGATNIITSPDSYNDGKWHYMVATQSSDGMKLYVDGQEVASGSQTQAQNYSGYWRVGGDSPWSGNAYFAGSIDEVAVYSSALDATTVQAHYAAAGGTLPNQTPTAAFTSAVNNKVATFTNNSTDPEGDDLTYAWAFGDGDTSTDANPTHTYSTAGSYSVKLTVTDAGNLTDSVTKTVSVTVPVADFTPSVKSLKASFDASDSTDPNGTITSYTWDFGDATDPGSGKTVDHTYGSAGTYTVKLTVKDDQGATDSVTKTVVTSAAGAVPKPDHVVVVVMENHSETNIIGDTTDAPYINSLASNGANMTNSFAEAHPSQPNYLAMFSGSTQGVTDDTCLTGSPLTTPSLYDQLAAEGDTFTGYSEDLPSVGYTGCQSGNYVRKHNPWVNWASVPASANQPFSAFPSDYSNLPTVSYVIPNLQHDMHDGTVAQGDTWLQNNLGDYVTWAKTHNSRLILTWDEDDNNDNNQIPTIIVGQGVKPGEYSQKINHYNVLRTTEDGLGLGTIGASTEATPITSIWGAPNQAPVAGFTDSASGLTATFTNTSSDPDGDSLTYAWNFGDGATSTAKTPDPHTYADSGTYTVKLTVTDPSGLSDTVSHDITVTAPPVNQAPVAGFTDSASGLTATFTNTSSDPDGDSLTYAWNFGDGATSTAKTPDPHAYADSGTYTVKLTVTDPGGLSDSVSHGVTVNAPAGQVIASDDFNRTVTNGWGSADVGGTWSRIGAGSNFAVGSGTGSITMPNPGSGPSIYLNDVSSSSTDMTVAVTTSQVQAGGPLYVSLIGRQIASVGSYRAVVGLEPGGVVRLGIVRVDTAGQADIVPITPVAGLTYSAGDVLDVRLVVSGTSPTAMSAKVWKRGTSEPANWQVSGSDASTPMQAAGGIGIMTYLSGQSTAAPMTASFSGLNVVPAAAGPAAMKAQTRALIRGTSKVHKSRIPTGKDRVSPPFGKSQFTDNR